MWPVPHTLHTVHWRAWGFESCARRERATPTGTATSPIGNQSNLIKVPKTRPATELASTGRPLKVYNMRPETPPAQLICSAHFRFACASPAAPQRCVHDLPYPSPRVHAYWSHVSQLPHPTPSLVPLPNTKPSGPGSPRPRAFINTPHRAPHASLRQGDADRRACLY
jgi:hypothetical protein